MDEQNSSERKSEGIRIEEVLVSNLNLQHGSIFGLNGSRCAVQRVYNCKLRCAEEGMQQSVLAAFVDYPCEYLRPKEAIFGGFALKVDRYTEERND